MEESRGVSSGGVKEALLHREKHFMAGELVRDVIMGMSDGLTVPFALAAGLSAATASSSIIVTAGLAEVAAGAISMGLGGYLAAKSEADHYVQERRREEEEIISVPDSEAAEVADILAKYGLQPNEYWPVVNALRKCPDAWTEFMMSAIFIDIASMASVNVPMCQCGVGPCVLKMSHTISNPGRQFWGFPNRKKGNNGCQYFWWVDETTFTSTPSTSIPDVGNDFNLCKALEAASATEIASMAKAEIMFL